LHILEQGVEISAFIACPSDPSLPRKRPDTLCGWLVTTNNARIWLEKMLCRRAVVVTPVTRSRYTFNGTGASFSTKIRFQVRVCSPTA